ncbi:MAG: glycosyl transferase [Patescibacteria group bacterium]|nr:MAG: glycosyl transferase [Patescibacteria group bacterium]
MKISVDFGAVEGKGYYGTKIFSENLKKALLKYDKNNDYIFYDFKTVKPKLFWSQLGLSLAELKNKPDVFLALNQSIPFYVNGKIISFSHGLSYYFYPEYYSKHDVSRLKKQLSIMVKRSQVIIVSSIKVKNELEKISEKNKNLKIINLPFGIPFDVLEFKNFKKINKKYFLVVANNQPIKNLNFIIENFLKATVDKNFYLYVVTNNADGLIKEKNIKYFLNISRFQLINLYSQSQALLTASFYESFNFPILETLFFANPVIALKSAAIPEFKNYVNIAKNEYEFINFLKKIPRKLDKKNIDELKEKFSWKKYVEKLIKLYQ